VSAMTREEILAAVADGDDLADADLRGANLAGANLLGANLAGADLAGAAGGVLATSTPSIEDDPEVGLKAVELVTE